MNISCCIYLSETTAPKKQETTKRKAKNKRKEKETKGKVNQELEKNFILCIVVECCSLMGEISLKEIK